MSGSDGALCGWDRLLRFAAALVVLAAVSTGQLGAEAAGHDNADLTQFVDPLIGAGGHGHVFVGANVPFGAVQVGPNNVFQGWDWCSGYHHSDPLLIGFSHLHLSGTGCADLGDILLMPHGGELSITPGKEYDPVTGYASRFEHSQETARAGYYAVQLIDADVRVELTATERAGFHRYQFPAGKPAKLVIDLVAGNDDRATSVGFIQQAETTLSGRRFSSGWAKDQRVFFALSASVSPAEMQYLNAAGAVSDRPEEACRALLAFPASTKEVLVKVGISAVSAENALLNVQTEIPHWDFDKTAAQARDKWNKALHAVEAEMLNRSAAKVFYTAMYHAMIAPSLFNDVNGDYRGADGEIHRAASFDNYTVLSLWDSYRAEHPLLTLIQPERVDDFVNTMIAIAEQQGKLPVWHLAGNETDTMVGYSAAPAIADAYLKGFSGFDAKAALAAMVETARRDERGLDQLKRRGYIPCDQELESVAKGLEYAIDDRCIAAFAERAGDKDVAAEFTRRASFFRNYFDPQSGFMRGKAADGSWRTPFNPIASAHRRDDYCEGNAWQYTWLVPQDVPGLISLLGGQKPFVDKWDQLFLTDAPLGDDASADISGLIGQYAHGNEPGHHVPYLAACAGSQWKTAARVRQIMTTLYDDTPAGLCGNEDCGQMSAWYVFSALGFYPVNPAGGEYVLGSPLVKEATIRFPDGKAFCVEAADNSDDNQYIQSAELNGALLDRAYITHKEIASGGKLTLHMGPEPNKAFPPQPGEPRTAAKHVSSVDSLPAASRVQPSAAAVP